VFHLFGHRRKPTVNSKFFQIQLLSIGTEQKSGENQAEASILERRDLLPAITTYNNNNSRSSSQKGKSTRSCKKKKVKSVDIVICAVQLARVCTSTCNDDLVAFPPEACVTLSDTFEILSTFFVGDETYRNNFNIFSGGEEVKCCRGGQ
jgi:hypothetical protein